MEYILWYTNSFKEKLYVSYMVKTLVSKTFREGTPERLDEVFNKYAREKSIGSQNLVNVSFTFYATVSFFAYSKSITYFVEDCDLD